MEPKNREWWPQRYPESELALSHFDIEFGNLPKGDPVGFREPRAHELKKEFREWHQGQLLSEEQRQKGEELIEKAFEWMKKGHYEKRRKATGERYYTHTQNVGYWPLKAGLPLPVGIAGLLHDMLEDTETSYQEIEDAFGHDVAYLVGRVSTPKYRIVNGRGRIVYPHEEQYSRKKNDEEQEWENKAKNKELLVKLQGIRLFHHVDGYDELKAELNEIGQGHLLDDATFRHDVDGPRIGTLDQYALVIKALDFLHNGHPLQMKNMDAAEKHLAKATLYGIVPFIMSLSPVFARSALRNRLFRKFFKERRSDGTDVLRGPDLKNLNANNIIQLSPADANGIHVHQSMQDERKYTLRLPFQVFGNRAQQKPVVKKRLEEFIQLFDPDATLKTDTTGMRPRMSQFHRFRLTRNAISDEHLDPLLQIFFRGNQQPLQLGQHPEYVKLVQWLQTHPHDWSNERDIPGYLKRNARVQPFWE